MVHYHSSFQPMKILFSQYFLFFLYVFATIQFIFVCNFKYIKWPQIFFLVSSHSILEQPTKPQQQQQNKWIILDVRSVCFEKDQYVGACKCCQISCLSPFQRDDSELGGLQNRSKGRILSRLLLLHVQLVITVFNSGLGQGKWHPFFSVSYLIRSCDCSLISDTKNVIDKSRGTRQWFTHPMVQIR